MPSKKHSKMPKPKISKRKLKNQQKYVVTTTVAAEFLLAAEA